MKELGISSDRQECEGSGAQRKENMGEESSLY